jgi:hypothetical protein
MDSDAAKSRSGGSRRSVSDTKALQSVVDIAYNGQLRHRTAPNTVVLPFLISLVQILDFC